MHEPLVFYSRCKPQEVDAIEIVLAEKRVFIGYPMARSGAPYNPRNLKSCVVDLSCSDEEWLEAHKASEQRRQFNQNRNLVKRVSRGSIALVPRPAEGVIYCGQIVSDFELVDAPTWYDKYMEIRGDDDSEETWHGADVAQCWRVDDLRPIPVPRIPAWIRRSLFGRSTYGVIHPDAIAGDPHPVLRELMEGQGFEDRKWTTEVAEVERRLLDVMTPAAFEHLVVSLLQLEHPEEVWAQVGGSGDGGVDGIGAGPSGEVTAILQCKWQYWGGNPFDAATSWRASKPDRRKYLASLRHPKNVALPGVKFLGREEIAELVVRHHERLPEAISMRIGQAP